MLPQDNTPTPLLFAKWTELSQNIQALQRHASWIKNVTKFAKARSAQGRWALKNDLGVDCFSREWPQELFDDRITEAQQQYHKSVAALAKQQSRTAQLAGATLNINNELNPDKLFADLSIKFIKSLPFEPCQKQVIELETGDKIKFSDSTRQRLLKLHGYGSYIFIEGEIGIIEGTLRDCIIEFGPNALTAKIDLELYNCKIEDPHLTLETSDKDLVSINFDSLKAAAIIIPNQPTLDQPPTKV